MLALSTISTAAIALGSALVGWLLNRESEHQRWLRESRLELYAEFIKTAHHFDRLSKQTARSHRPGDWPDKQVVKLLDIRRTLGDLDDQIRIVGSRHRASDAGAILALCDQIVTIDEEEHGAMAFVDPDSHLSGLHVEVFSAGVRREMRADGLFGRLRPKAAKVTS